MRPVSSSVRIGHGVRIAAAGGAIVLVAHLLSCGSIGKMPAFEKKTGVIQETYDASDNCEIVYQVWDTGLRKKVTGVSGKPSPDPAIREGWVDDNTFRTVVTGGPKPGLTATLARRQSARNAAILMAQKRVMEKFTGARIEGASGAADYSSSGIAVAKEFGAIIKGGGDAGIAKGDIAGSAAKDGAPAGKQEQQRGRAMQDQKPKALYLSADDSNSSASAVIARMLIRQGKYVPPAVVRTYEFLNYYSFDYQAPESKAVAIIPNLRALDDKGKYSLQIAVRSRDKTIAESRPYTITLLLDISGSMAGRPIELAKTFVQKFIGRLRTGDIVSLVVFNRKATVIAEAHRIGKRSARFFEKRLKKISVNDVTDLEQGIAKAYDIAAKQYGHDRLNRVVVISDGAANAGKLSIETISRHAKDSDRQGIYLAGIGLGNGFNDQLMNAVTDKGRGAYLFVDSGAEIDHILEEDNFVANFDLAVKDVRLKLQMPEGWKREEFHGEQISEQASDIVPQYLAPNDQMIYHMTVSTTKKKGSEADASVFEFEAEYTPIGGKPAKLSLKRSLGAMLKDQLKVVKGDAIVAYAEMLKKIKYPLGTNQKENMAIVTRTHTEIKAINALLKDEELSDVLALLAVYRETLQYGEKFPGARDGQENSADAILGIPRKNVIKVQLRGESPDRAIMGLSRLNQSLRLVPLEGYKFLALSNGPVGSPYPAGGGQLSAKQYDDSTPPFMGLRRTSPREKRAIYDLHQVVLTLRAPKNARSFSFDFNFFSAEYPNFVKQKFNDTFFATLSAKSTNNGAPTNISFDTNNNPIEVDNNYFQNPFHPIPNDGTGFDRHGSTGWLRTSWPIQGGETFTLVFSIHDEGDGVYDSLAVIDNFRWHTYTAVGTTDPLN